MSRQYGAGNNKYIARNNALTLPTPLKLTDIAWIRLDSDVQENSRAGALTAFTQGADSGGFAYISNEAFIDDGSFTQNALYTQLETVFGGFERLWDGGNGTQYARPNDCFDQSAGWTCLAYVIDHTTTPLRMDLYSRQGNQILKTVCDLPEPIQTNLDSYSVGAFLGFPGGALPGKVGPRYTWFDALSEAEIIAQMNQIAPVRQSHLEHFSPGLDSPVLKNYAPGKSDFTGWSGAGTPEADVSEITVSPSNPPLSWTRSGGLL